MISPGYAAAALFGGLIFALLSGFDLLIDRRAKIRLRMLFLETDPRVNWPFLEKLNKFVAQVTPPKFLQNLITQKEVIRSGIPCTHPQYLSCWWLGLETGLVFWLIGVFILREPLAVFALGLIFLLLVGLIPYLVIKKLIRNRKKEIELGLPYFLDLLTFTVEAGLGFKPALERVNRNLEGVLRDEIFLLLDRLNLGYSNKESFAIFVDRNPSRELDNFFQAVLLSGKLGTSLARTLFTQAELLRTRRRQRAEEKVKTAPIRIIPALVFFFLPGLLLIYLAPPIINFLQYK